MDRGSRLSLQRQSYHHSSLDTLRVFYSGTLVPDSINSAGPGCAFCWVQNVWLSCQQHGQYLFIPQDYLTGTGTSQPAGMEIHLICSHLVLRRLFCSSLTLHLRSSLCFTYMFNSQPSCVFQESYCQIQSPAHDSPAKPGISCEERLGEADTQHCGLERKLYCVLLGIAWNGLLAKKQQALPWVEASQVTGFDTFMASAIATSWCQHL